MKSYCACSLHAEDQAQEPVSPFKLSQQKIEQVITEYLHLRLFLFLQSLKVLWFR